MLCLNAKIREVSCVSVILRLNCKKEVAAEVVRALTVENKVRLMSVQGKRQQTMYARRI